MENGVKITRELQPLRQLVVERERIAPREASRIVLEVVDQLEIIHAGGMLHRHLSVDSVYVDSTGSVVLGPPPEVVTSGGTGSEIDLCPLQMRQGIPLRLPRGMSEVSEMLAEQGSSIEPAMIDLHQAASLLCYMLSGKGVSYYLHSCKGKAAIPSEMRGFLDRALGVGKKPPFETCHEFKEEFCSISSPDKPHMKKADSLPRTVFQMSGNRQIQSDSDDDLSFGQLGHYEIIHRIGRGGMGDVYKAYEEALDRHVAIKVLPSFLQQESNTLKRFRAEATAVAQLDHPNIVQIYFIGEDQGRHFYAMRLIEGQNLGELLADRGQLSCAEAVTIAIHCLSGLSEAHERGLVHRDVKPANILLDPQSRRAVLTDFGLVKAAKERTQLTMTGMIMGTADYIAPEQAKGGDVDHRADLYSVGIILHQMLSGELPFRAESATAMMFQHAYESPPRLNPERYGIPEELVDTVAKLLAKSPEDRYQNADDAIAALQEIRRRIVVCGDHSIMLVSEPADQEIPSLPPSFGEIHPPNGWKRMWNWLADFLCLHRNRWFDGMQATQKDMNGILAEYEAEKGRLVSLLQQARENATEFRQLADQQEESQPDAEQASTTESSDCKELTDGCPTDVDELLSLADEQDAQAQEIEFRIGQLDAQLIQLRAQQNVLAARLKLAGVRWELNGGQRNRARRNGLLAVIVSMVALVIVLGMISWIQSGSVPAPVRAPAVNKNVRLRGNVRGKTEPVPRKDTLVAGIPLSEVSSVIYRGKMAIDSMRVGVRAFQNRNYVFINIPNELVGFKFVRQVSVLEKEYAVEAIKDGVLLAACMDSDKGKECMEPNGWTPTETKFQYTDSSVSWMRVWKKDVKKGLVRIPGSPMTFTGVMVLAPDILTKAQRTETDDNANKVFGALSTKLNDFSNWAVRSGTWEKTAEGRILGRGDSRLRFMHDLPAEFTLQFRMKMLEGMRPRVYLHNDDSFYIGNEGFEKTLYVHGKAAGTPLVGEKRPYANGEDVTVKVVFEMDSYRVYVNGLSLAYGNRDIRKNSLSISAGDDWSKGAAEFWDFQVTPVD